MYGIQIDDSWCASRDSSGWHVDDRASAQRVGDAPSQLSRRATRLARRGEQPRQQHQQSGARRRLFHSCCRGSASCDGVGLRDARGSEHARRTQQQHRMAGEECHRDLAGIAQTSEPELDEAWSCSAFFGAPFATGFTCRGVVWEWGAIRALPTLGGRNSFATGANNRRQVVGWSENTVVSTTVFSDQPTT